MSTIFDFASLQTAEAEQATADFTEYQSLLREIAAGKCKRSKPEILAILKDVDQDVKLLEKNVQKRVKRDTMILEVEKEKEYEAERNTLSEQIKEHWEKFEKIKEDFNEKDWPMRCKRDGLDKKLREISGYRSELIESCDDMSLILERNEAQARLRNPAEGLLYESQRRLADEIATAEQSLNRLPLSPDRNEQKRELKALIKQLRARYEEGEAKKIDFKKQEEKQKVAIREIEERMIRS